MEIAQPPVFNQKFIYTLSEFRSLVVPPLPADSRSEKMIREYINSLQGARGMKRARPPEPAPPPPIASPKKVPVLPLTQTLSTPVPPLVTPGPPGTPTAPPVTPGGGSSSFGGNPPSYVYNPSEVLSSTDMDYILTGATSFDVNVNNANQF